MDPGRKGTGTLEGSGRGLKPLKVVHIRDSGGLYGAERVILGSCSALREMKVEPTIVSILDRSGAGRPLIEAARDLNLKAEVLHARHTLDVRAIWNLRVVLKAWRPDVVHAHDLRSALFGLAGTRGLTVATVATAHGSTRESSRKRLYLKIFEELLLPKFDRVHVVSDPLADHLRARGVPSEKIRVIPNGVDEAVVQRPPGLNPLAGYRGDPTLCAVGRLTEDKGILLLLAALATLKGEFPGARLILAGSGPQEEELKEEARRLNLADCVHFCGRVDTVAWIYDIADLLVLPSLREGLPCVLLEAMLAGLPVVASAVGAIPEALAGGELGKLVPPSDRTALTGAIRDVIGNLETFRGVARQAREVARTKYTAQVMAGRLRNLYEDAGGPG